VEVEAEAETKAWAAVEVAEALSGTEPPTICPSLSFEANPISALALTPTHIVDR
jgi:hypothetical protein